MKADKRDKKYISEYIFKEVKKIDKKDIITGFLTPLGALDLEEFNKEELICIIKIFGKYLNKEREEHDRYKNSMYSFMKLLVK